ncbi:S24/S26 family peptidase [Candidatus Omnitrophota bacterium]
MDQAIKVAEQAQDLSFFEARGFSMWPFLKERDKLLVKKTPLSRLEVGDLVLHRSNSSLVCHRLVRKSKSNGQCSIYTRGDASWSQPEAINQERVLGKVIGVMKENRIAYVDGVGQRLINRIILLILPLWRLVIKAYQFLFVRK